MDEMKTTGQGRYWKKTEDGKYELRCVFPMCSPPDEQLAVLRHIKPDSWVYTVMIPQFLHTEILWHTSLESAKKEIERVVGNHLGFLAELEKSRYDIFNIRNTGTAAMETLRKLAGDNAPEIISAMNRLFDTYGKEKVLFLISPSNETKEDREAREAREARYAELAASLAIEDL